MICIGSDYDGGTENVNGRGGDNDNLGCDGGCGLDVRSDGSYQQGIQKIT